MRRKTTASLVTTIVAASVAACAGADDGSPQGLVLDHDRELSGGEGTIFDTTKNAFAYPLRNLSGARRDAFAVGDHLFNRAWVPAGTPNASGDVGLGPTFNATSCSACHTRDGRGAPPEGDAPWVGMLVRLSVPGEDEHGGPVGEPSYGGQLNPQGIAGVPAEGTPRVSYTDVPGTYGDGAPFVLRRPEYRVEHLAFGPLARGTMASPRVAPATFGLGLLEAIDDATLVALSDPDDRDGDGISGRTNVVWDYPRGARRIGRFGWKANQPTIVQQTAGAFLGDIGITSALFPNENCPGAQEACGKGPTGKPGDHELPERTLELVTSYGLTLAVPARRDVSDPEVERGERLFYAMRCVGCHTPKLETGDYSDIPELSRQTIRPFTDLLLHDMGEGLADHRPDYLATGAEWRTPPLWGIGLVSKVNGHERFLHDGRARGFEEAILWHGGESQRSKEAFRTSSAADRAAMVRFLRSL
jgi:CxxC motif-containing protein (DUF1111 family)